MAMNHVALITGGGRGIGRAIALKVAAAGYDVAVNYRGSAAGAEEIASRIIILGRRAIAVQADVSDPAAVSAMVAEVEDKLGSVSLLVNNAGLSWNGLFQDMTYEDWRRLFAVNVDGDYHCIQAVLPRMLAEKEGNIINISSIWGGHGASCEVAYAATKAALEGLTRSLAAEWPPRTSASTPWPRAASKRICWTPWGRRPWPPWRRKRPWAASALPRTWPRWCVSWRRRIRSLSPARSSRRTADSPSESPVKMHKKYRLSLVKFYLHRRAASGIIGPLQKD